MGKWLGDGTGRELYGTYGERLNEKQRKEDVQDGPKMSYLSD